MKNVLISRHSEVEELVNQKLPFAEIARRLQVARDTATTYIKKHWPDYKGNQGSKNRIYSNRRTPILERIGRGAHVTPGDIRRRLIEAGYKEQKCECCGLSEWMDKPIPLELHHKNLNHWDNSLENLQILCSNCHMQAHNYCNIKSKH